MKKTMILLVAIFTMLGGVTGAASKEFLTVEEQNRRAMEDMKRMQEEMMFTLKSAVMLIV